CDEGRLGARCEVGDVAKAGQTSSSATTTAVVLIVLLVLAAVALGLYWHRKHPFIICKSKRGSSSRVFKFVNPAFGVMSDETILNSSPVPSSCPSSDNPPPYAFTNPHPGHNFENPFFKADDSQANTSLDSAVASATDSTSVNIITSQVDLSSPLPPEMKFATPAEKKFKWPLSDPYNPSQV
ncbi:putative vitellogenin receptor-like 2, partial [Homarus americanus]